MVSIHHTRCAKAADPHNQCDCTPILMRDWYYYGPALEALDVDYYRTALPSLWGREYHGFEGEDS